MTDELQLDYLYPSKRNYQDVINDIYLYTIPQLNGTNFATILQKYQQHFPKVKISITEGLLPDIVANVSQNPYSIGLLSIAESNIHHLEKLGDDLITIPYRHVELVALVGQQNTEVKNCTSLSLSQLVHMPLIIYAPQGLDSSLAYRALKSYGEPNIIYVVDNTSLFLSLLQSGQYFSLGDQTIFSHTDLRMIPLQDPPAITTCFLLQKEALQSYTLKSLVNLLLTQNGRPPV